jgi:hypothetical protein
MQLGPGFFSFWGEIMLGPNIELSRNGNFIFYSCAGCGHVGISSPGLTPDCHHCQSNDVDWLVVKLEDFYEDMKLIEQQLSLITIKK